MKRNIWIGNNKVVCYIVAAFMLIMGMCQSRVEADFCFPYAQDGRISSFLEVFHNDVLAGDISIAEKPIFPDNVVNTVESRREGKRLVLRLLWYITSVFFIIQNVSVYLRSVTADFVDRSRTVAVILSYLHAQDGKKRFA